jgi:outer membrane protein TolC
MMGRRTLRRPGARDRTDGPARRTPAALGLAGALAAGVLVAGPVLADETALVVGIPAAPGEETEPLTLDQCVERALADNLDLARVRLGDDRLSGQSLQAIATGLPSLDLTGNWTRSRDPSFQISDTFGGGDGADVPAEFDSLFAGFADFTEVTSQTYWTGSITSDWELNPFRVWNAIGGVGVAREQFDEDVRGEENRVVAEAVQTFHEAVFHQETVAALDAEIAARREFLDIARQRFRLDLATELDTLQAAVALANLRPERRNAETNLRNATSRLNLLMGRDATVPLTLAPVEAIEDDVLPPDVAVRAVDRRPDLRSAELNIRFLQKRRGVERADRKPFLSMNGSYGWVGRDVNDVIDRDYESWRASVSLILPVFDGLSTMGRTRELDADIEAARRGLENSRRAAWLEIATLLQQLEAARENHTAAALTLKAADLALEKTTLRYEIGQAEYLAVLNAQSDRFSARSHLIEARYEVQSRTAALKRALGFHPRTPLALIREELEGSKS